MRSNSKNIDNKINSEVDTNKFTKSLDHEFESMEISSKSNSQKVDDDNTKNLNNLQTKNASATFSKKETKDDKNLDKQKDGKKKKSKVGNIITWICAGVIFALIFVIVIMLIVGFRPAVVLTPSMSPSIKPGDLIVYKSVDAEKIKVGDVITFWPSDSAKANKETSVTHRVMEIIADGDGTLSFITKGDNNNTADGDPLPEERIIGKVSFHIPWVGQMFLFIKNNIITVVFSIISIMLLWYLISYFIKSKKEDDNNNSANKETIEVTNKK